MKNYNNCSKCGHLVPQNKLFSALHNDPNYKICEICIYEIDNCCVGLNWEDFRKLD